MFIAGGLRFFERSVNARLHFVQKRGLEGLMQQIVVKMSFSAPYPAVPNAAFRNQAVDVGVPFQVPAESVEDASKARG